jgi:hypothetical protein
MRFLKSILEKSKKLSCSSVNLGLSRFFFCLFLLVFVHGRAEDYMYLPHYFWFPSGIFIFFDFLASPIDLSYLEYAYFLFGILATLGLKCTWTVPIFAFLATLWLGYSHNFTHIYSPTAPLVVALWFLALSKCGDSFSLDSLINKGKLFPHHQYSFEYWWPLFIIKLYYVLIWASAGYQKITLGWKAWSSGEFLLNLMGPMLFFQKLSLSDNKYFFALLSCLVILLELFSFFILFKMFKKYFLLIHFVFLLIANIAFGVHFYYLILFFIFFIDFKSYESQMSFLTVKIKSFLSSASSNL